MSKKHLLALLCFICTVLAAFADEPFRNHRYDTFKVTPINEQSIVFVGNSITNMHPWVEAFGNDPRVVNRGNSGGTSAEIRDNARSYCAGHPAKIFLMIGINDKPSSSNQATIVSNIEQTIKTIQTESPRTKVYVQSILPSGWFSNPTNIANCNNAIQAMLTNYPDVQYIDVYSQLLGKLDIDETGVYSFDKLHTTAAGYAIWTDYIKEYVGLEPVYPSESATKAAQLNGGNPKSFGARATYFSMLPIASDDVLFFGDEMVHGAEWQELLRNPNVKNRGTNWGYEKADACMNYTSNDIDVTFAKVNGVTKQEPKQVLLYTGTGEVNGSAAISTVVARYEAIVSKIRAYAPHAKIGLVSLMPTRSYNNNARVKQFNAAIQGYALEQENVEYIDIYSTLATSDNQPKDEYFGPYSTPAKDTENYIYGDGYIAIANVLANSIEGCNPVTVVEAAAYRDLIKGVVPEETPAVTITNVQCDGTTPFPISDETAAAIKKMTAHTTVIDFTSAQVPAQWASIIGSSSSDKENFFSIGILSDGRLGVRYTGLQGIEGWYTRDKVNPGSLNQRIVVVQNPADNGLVQLYIDGVRQYSLDNNSLGAYGCVTYNTRAGQSVYLGGLVTRNFTNKFPFIGTINSLRIYDKALSPEQIADLTYDLTDDSHEQEGPATVDYIVDAAHGTLTGSNPDSSWRSHWVSTKEPQLVLDCGANNMAYDGDGFRWETGTAASSNYLLTAPTGYLIKDVQFTAKAMTRNSVTLTFNGETYTTRTTGETFKATDINKASTGILLTGLNLVNTHISDLTVTVIRKDIIVDPDDPNAEPEAFTVFSNRGSIPYRIPAIATAQNGNLICVADYRTSRKDIGNGEIDLHVRLSKDNGKTWEPIMRPAVMDGDANFTKGYQLGAFGDPCIVADRESGRVLLMSCSGYKGYFVGSRDWHQGLARWYSDDNGETWNQAPDIIDEEFIYGPMDASKYGPITGMFIGSGKIHQSRYVKVKDYYRLYCAFSSHIADTRNSQNFVIYSDDFGMTWDFLGGVNSPAVPNNGDEPKCEELPDGNLLFSGRIMDQGGRHYNIFRFTNREKAEGQWTGLATSNSYNDGILGNNPTNGEILLVPVVNLASGAKHFLALQSVPWGPERANVGIQWKALDEDTYYSIAASFAENWEGKHQVSEVSSCYSTMCVQADHTIAFVYEENGYNSGFDIQYKNYTIECLTGGRYAYDTEYESSHDPLGVIQTNRDEVDTRKAGIFGLSGQRLDDTPSHPLQKGVYVIDGVKVVK